MPKSNKVPDTMRARSLRLNGTVKSGLMYRFSLSLILLLGIAASASGFELQEHAASYTANIKKGVSIKGEAVRSLTKVDADTWLYRFDVESFIADIKESSRLKVIAPEIADTGTTPDALAVTPAEQKALHIQSLDYQYTLSAFLMPDRKRHIIFDWQNKTAKSPLKDDKWTLEAIPDNSYDPLSYQLQLLLDVHAGKQEMNYQLAKEGKLRESTFVVLGEEIIETRFGKLKSIVAKKQRDEDAKRETFLWFSADHPLLLLKMTQRESDGEEYEIQLKEASIAGKRIDFSAHRLN